MRFLSSYVQGWLARQTIHSLGNAGSSADGIATAFPTYDLFESSHSNNCCNYYSDFTVEETKVQRHLVIYQGHRTSE